MATVDSAAGVASVAPISAAAVVEDVLRQHGSRISDRDLASRRAGEEAARRSEAAVWLRRVASAAARDLPEEPTEEQFRLGLRNGQVLCDALNAVQPRAVAKVVVNPMVSALQPDGAALSAYQYFENVRNFLVALNELGIPTFEASDLEQGGKSTRVVNCVLAMKSYAEWKQSGGSGSWKFCGSVKPPNTGKFILRKNTDLFQNSLSRSQSMRLDDRFFDEQSTTWDAPAETAAASDMAATRPLKVLISAVLSDKRPDEVPTLLESMLGKVIDEFENRLCSQNELMKSAMLKSGEGSKSFLKSKVAAEVVPSGDTMNLVEDSRTTMGGPLNKQLMVETRTLNHNALEKQGKDIEELKSALQMTKAGVEFIQKKYTEDLSLLGKHLYGLSHAASSYHKVLEENRKLYNQVQDLKGSIRVYCRVRPFLPGQINATTVGAIDDGNITIVTPSKYGKEGRRTFVFNKVFGPSATQDEVFLDTQPLIRSVLDGYNVCIFAYGQTGSGKTYTMSGPKNPTEHTLGVNYRALSDLFKLAEQRKGVFTYEIAVQMMEIYNEQVRDLLVSDGLNRRLEIRNNSSNGLNVPDANLVQVSSTYDVIELMNVGYKNRAVGATALNDRSSRSHSCLTVHVQGRDLTSGAILRGCMHLVDLAGSERVDKSEVTGERLKEAQHINKSLSALGDVIAALAQKQGHVPYRNSKLTQLLQDSLGGQAKTLMFVHISPEVDAIGETISTLKFAERVSTVELGAARMNKESGEVKELKEQIARLKAELAMKDGAAAEYNQNVVQTPDRVKLRLPSPAPSSRHGNLSTSIYRQPMGELGNLEVVPNKSLFTQKKPMFSAQNLILAADLPTWPSSNPRVNVNGAEDTEMMAGKWIDKVVVNNMNPNAVEDSEAGLEASLPDFFYRRYHHSDMTDAQRSRFNSTNNTDDSDDLDMATSDSSESDALWQFNSNLQKTNSSAVEGGSKIKKPQIKQRGGQNSGTPSQVCRPSPSPSKKSIQVTNRSERQLPDAAANRIRSSSNGRLPNAK